MKPLFKFVVPTESEIAANHAGMNTFFGAVLGFVMAGTERLDSLEFSNLLFLVAGIVISILYVSASRQKVLYVLMTVLMIVLLPDVLKAVLDEGESIPDKLQPTLLVWTALTVLVEFLPRRPDDAATPQKET